MIDLLRKCIQIQKFYIVFQSTYDEGYFVFIYTTVAIQNLMLPPTKLLPPIPLLEHYYWLITNGGCEIKGQRESWGGEKLPLFTPSEKHQDINCAIIEMLLSGMHDHNARLNTDNNIFSSVLLSLFYFLPYLHSSIKIWLPILLATFMVATVNWLHC